VPGLEPRLDLPAVERLLSVGPGADSRADDR
jgi:hypothetical protein